VFLNNNAFEDLTPLANKKQLTTLHASVNLIKSVPLKGCVKLRSLHIDHNRVLSLEGLETCTSLRRLSVSANRQLKDLGPLAKLEFISYLELDYCKVSDITPLLNLKSARDIYLRYNPVNDSKAASKKSRDKLKAALPDCIIRFN
jgi:Leucine-rich repeat (LRR) protein